MCQFLFLTPIEVLCFTFNLVTTILLVIAIIAIILRVYIPILNVCTLVLRRMLIEQICVKFSQISHSLTCADVYFL